ncbi:MAG: hypothetical protein A2915_01625 [Candidatus Yanofskybacteria bacterium RIFCSPLOWO2_01_FULL_41_34]|nr:MAG: hypothetical protein A2915_01625 [Candidatus Yanofskybacteria bacterium RIFCSPLOWO2_01_FULL_41_34]
MKKGNSNTEGLIILAVLIVIIIFITAKGGSQSAIDTSPGSFSNTTNISTGSTATPSSTYAKDISISTGNAAYSYQSYEEYVTIYNRGRDPVDITGWQVRNAKNKRAYAFGGELRYFPRDSAIIPRAALFVAPSSTSILQNVILETGDTAVITTGSIASQSPYKIVSFKENICSGYLGNMDEYSFTPSLSMTCPRPADEIGVEGLDTECRNFIKRMPSCRTPEFDTRDRDGNICRNCVDGKPLSSPCVTFIKNHFNYGSCIAYHRNDQNFSGKTWRIFLGQGWEMWAKDYETISLFDQLGRLVVERSY